MSDNEMYTCIESGMICVAACGVCCGHCSNGEENPDADLVSNDEDTCYCFHLHYHHQSIYVYVNPSARFISYIT